MKRFLIVLTVLVVLPVCEASGATWGDFDGDGKAEVLWWKGFPSGYRAAVWHMDGATRLDTAIIGRPVWPIVGLGDFDKDGKANDLLGVTLKRAAGDPRSFRRLAVWGFNGSTTKVEGKVYDTDWTVVSVADYDGNGGADLLWHNQVTGKLVFWYMDGIFRSGIGHFEKVRDTDWRVVGAGDFDGDGDPDLIWRHAVKGSIYVWRIESGVLVSIHKIGTVRNQDYHIGAVGDFDGDGDADLFWRDAEGKSYVWIMDDLIRSAVIRTNRDGGFPATEDNLKWQVVGPR